MNYEFEQGTQNVDNYPSESGQEIPLSELFVDRDKNAVFAQITDARPIDRDLPLFLTQQMLIGKRVIFFGPPGVGKTTLLFQAIANAKENANALGIFFDPDVAQYDLVLAQSKDKSEGEVLNQELIYAFQNADGCENVGVGTTDEKDRGVSANEDFLRKIGSGQDSKTIMVALPQVKTNQIFSGLLRAEISMLRPGEVFDALERHNVHFEGVPKTPEVAAFLIRMYKNMGKKENIDKIQKEEEGLISEWALALQLEEMKRTGTKSVPTIFEKRVPGLIIPPTLTAEVMGNIYRSFGVTDTPFIERLTQNAIDDYCAQAVRMEYLFRDTYRIGPQRGIVAVNPWRDGIVIQDLSPYTKSRSSLT